MAANKLYVNIVKLQEEVRIREEQAKRMPLEPTIDKNKTKGRAQRER